MKEKFRLEVQTRQDDPQGENLFYAFFYYRYSSLESAIKSAQFIISTYKQRILGVSVYQGVKFIKAICD